MTIATACRFLAVSAIIGAATSGHAQGTDWGSLDTSGWGGRQAPQTAPAGGAEFVTSISLAFQDLGMAEARADCYGRVLHQKLKPKTPG